MTYVNVTMSHSLRLFLSRSIEDITFLSLMFARHSRDTFFGHLDVEYTCTNCTLTVSVQKYKNAPVNEFVTVFYIYHVTYRADPSQF